jgi:hypothetical protein
MALRFLFGDVVLQSSTWTTGLGSLDAGEIRSPLREVIGIDPEGIDCPKLGAEPSLLDVTL